MEITFAKRKLQKHCSTQKAMQQKFGTDIARRLARRLQELEAAESLEELRALPQARPHELTGDRKGQIALDLIHPHRLIVEAGVDPAPLRDDGGLDWERVSAITIIEVTDYHE